MPRAPALAALLAAALLAAPLPSSAQGWVAVSGGAALPTGGAVAAGGGASWSASVTGALQGGYDLDHVGASLSIGTFSTQAGSQLSVAAFPMLLRLRARLPLGIAIPYAFGGVGVAPCRAQYVALFEDAAAFTAQAGAGVEVRLGDRFLAGAEAAYQWARPTFSMGTLDLDTVVIQALVGVRI